MGDSKQDLPEISESLILALAGRLETLYDVMDRLDDAEIGVAADPKFAKSKDRFAAHLETVRQANDETIGRIEQSIIDNPAENLADAAIQLMLAAGFTDCVRNGCDSQANFYIDKVAQLIDSALNVIVRDTDLDIAKYGGGRYIPNYANFSARNRARELSEMLELTTAKVDASSQMSGASQSRETP